MTARHGASGGLCELEHQCPPCEAGEHYTGCDLFTHPVCGLVACGCACTAPSDDLPVRARPVTHEEHQP